MLIYAEFLYGHQYKTLFSGTLTCNKNTYLALWAFEDLK